MFGLCKFKLFLVLLLPIINTIDCEKENENQAAPPLSLGSLPGDVADTGSSPYPTAGAGQAGVGGGPVPLTEGCRPRGPGLAMAAGGTPGERPGPARGAEVCTFT